MSVILRYPPTAPTATRFLVARGKYAYTSRDGAVKKGTRAYEAVRCPVPSTPPPGRYGVIVSVRDVEGKLRETAWSFELKGKGTRP